MRTVKRILWPYGPTVLFVSAMLAMVAWDLWQSFLAPPPPEFVPPVLPAEAPSEAATHTTSEEVLPSEESAAVCESEELKSVLPEPQSPQEAVHFTVFHQVLSGLQLVVTGIRYEDVGQPPEGQYCYANSWLEMLTGSHRVISLATKDGDEEIEYSNIDPEDAKAIGATREGLEEAARTDCRFIDATPQDTPEQEPEQAAPERPKGVPASFTTISNRGA